MLKHNDDIFVNIMVICNPNYNNKGKIGAVKKKYNNKKLSYVEQFIVFYHSIKKNWTLPYRINLLHSLNFSKKDRKILNSLDINLIKVRPDDPNFKHICRWRCYVVPLKKPGTHRLLLDIDMIALKDPVFNYNLDIQVSVGETIRFKKPMIDFVCKKYGYEIPKGKLQGCPFREYYLENKKDMFPYLNNGAVLIKNSFIKKFAPHFKATVKLFKKEEWKTWKNYKNITRFHRHFSRQILLGIIVVNLTKKWDYFPKGFNYLGKVLSLNKFDINQVTLYHYLGTNGQKEALKYFKQYFFVLDKYNG